MTYKIETHHALPCATSLFEINGIEADKDDFGDLVFNGGSCMECQCGSEFEPNYTEVYIKDACHKYGITPDEYEDICDALRDELYVNGCGWCS